MIKQKLIIVCLLLCGLNLYGQDKNKAENPVVAKLTTFLTGRPTEKAYLQFDKPFYATGDTIYFKAYVTLGERHNLSTLSGVLHADLIGADNKISQSIKLQIINGLAWGDFSLPDSLPKGNYRVRAYTRWMRNNGDAAFFERIIPVGSPEKDRVAESMPAGIKVTAKPDTRFFAEGGTFINSIRSKIAFKSVGTNGKGIDITGVVFDNSGNEVCRFSSGHLGMGYFYLQSQDDKTYTAKLSYADGSRDVVKLPDATASGLVLTVNNDSLPKASVRIEANKSCFAQNRDKNYMLLIYSGGVATSVTCKLDSTVILLDIAKRRLHTGVATVTLFSPDGEPLAERLFFVQNYDQLKLDVKSDKPIYTTKGKVDFTLSAKTRADSVTMGHFSVSVVDESKVPANENEEHTILTDLLLTSDLKGDIEQPGYYFANVNDDVRSNLDLVMLTHGYRSFEWKPMLNNAYPAIAYQPEKGLEITGTAKMLGGRPLAKGSVSLIAPASGGGILSSTTDDKGNFRFANLVYMDSAKFILQAVNAKGSNNTVLTYKIDKPVPVTPALQAQTLPDTATNAYMNNDKKKREALVGTGLITGKMLREVKIKGRKLTPVVNDTRYGVAEQVVDGAKIEYGGFLADRLRSKLRGIDFIIGPHMEAVPILNRSKVLHLPPMMVVLDGQEMVGGFDVNSLNTGSIDKIEVMTNATVAAGGLMVITTIKGVPLRDIVSKGILPINTIGFYKAREFYSPKYESTDAGKAPDFRTTIYWSPELATGKDGNAHFEFYNADTPGSYRVVVEGIDEKGNLGRLVYHYKVE